MVGSVAWGRFSGCGELRGGVVVSGVADEVVEAGAGEVVREDFAVGAGGGNPYDAVEVGSVEGGAGQVGVGESGVVEVGIGEVDAAQRGARQVEIGELATGAVGPGFGRAGAGRPG